MGYNTRTEFVISAIQDKLSSHNTRRILDIGFIGEYDRPFIHEAIVDNCPDDFIVGIDIGQRVKAFKGGRNREYLNLSVFDIDREDRFEEAFDIAVLCEVFEHLIHPYLALHKINYCLKKNGILIMTYPNPIGLRRLIRYLLQGDVTDKANLKKYLGANDHKVFPMPPSLIAYSHEIGFEAEKVSFLKGKMRGIPILEKLSSYVGIVSVKKENVQQSAPADSGSWYC